MFQSKKGKELSEKLEKITDFMIISLLWCLYSLPIFTIGAATSAMYYTTVKCIKEKEGYVWQHFHKSFKNTFKQATVCWGLFLFILSVLFLNQKLIENGTSALWFNQAIQFFLLIILLGSLPFLYFSLTYMSRFTDPLKTVLVNSLALMAFYKKQSLIITLILLSSALITWLIPLVVVLLPAMMTHFLSEFIETIYMKHATDS